jgi:hypothetical protein
MCSSGLKSRADRRASGMLRASPTTRPRCSSIVMPIFAVPQDLHDHAGWTSRAARSDPHDLRVPCTVILRTPALLMRRSNSVKVGSSFGVQCRMVNARPDSPRPSPECLPSVSCSCLRSLSTATQGQGEEAELLIPRSWQGCHRSCRPTRWTCWLTRNPAFTRARDGCLIHRTLRVTQPISKHVVCETLTGR